MNTSHRQRDWPRWLIVVFYATAMAWVEAAVVYYLRTMIDRIEPYQPNPLPSFGGLAGAELVREAATLVMIFAVGTLAGRTWKARLGFMAVIFGVWDIFYYVFLRLLTGWPHSLVDWDILFLLPLPWWGPVLAPVLIATLMILWGTLVTQFERTASSPAQNTKLWALGIMGSMIALYLFMEDAIHVTGEGEAALRNVLPHRFDWLLFSFAFLLMCSPVIAVCTRVCAQTKMSAASDKPV